MTGVLKQCEDTEGHMTTQEEIGIMQAKKPKVTLEATRRAWNRFSLRSDFRLRATRTVRQ